MKKIISMAITLVMLLSFPAVVFAAPGDKREEIEIYVENQDQIMEFYDSSEYNLDYRYSFIYPNSIQPRILCPSCGYNTYKGYDEDKEWGADGKGCPTQPDLVLDVCTNYRHYTWSECRTCGYKTSKSYQGIKLLKIECHADTWGDAIYWAKPGQRWQNGWDMQEEMSTWGY